MLAKEPAELEHNDNRRCFWQGLGLVTSAHILPLLVLIALRWHAGGCAL